MSFLYPAFLVGAVAVALPIVLHLLRRDVAPHVAFSAVRLLRRAPVERSRRRRLRDLLLLAARVAALLLLAAAFARPYLQGAESAGTLVVGIDRSFSMNAAGRFERAVQLARSAIDNARTGERVALATFDERAEILAKPGSRSDALNALSAVRPGFGATRYAGLFDTVADLARGGQGRIVLVTDLQRAGWAERNSVPLSADWPLELQDVGAFSNAAVTSLRVEADRVVALIQSWWDMPRSGRVRISAADRELASTQYALPPRGTIEVPITLKLPEAGGIAVAIDDPDGLPADDVRYAAVGTSQSRVLIVSGGAVPQSGFFLQRALDTSAEEDDGFVADIVAGQALSKSRIDELNANAAIVLLSTRSLDRQARDAIVAFTRAGGGLIIVAAPDLEASIVSAMFDWTPPLAPVVRAEASLGFAATDVRHPIFRPFGSLSANLGRVRFERGWRIRPDGWTVVARFTDGTPALLERAEGNGRVLLYASDMDRRWNDFPLHPAFVPFTLESVQYAAGARRSPREFRVVDVPSGVEPRPGLYQLGSDRRFIAVNADVRESVVERTTEDEFRRMVARESAAPAPATRLQAQQAEAAQSFWRYGLALMLLVLVAESVVGRA